MLHKRMATYLCCLMMFVYGISIVIFSTLLNEISSSFHLDLVHAGLLFSISYSGFILFIFAGGMLAERYGKKRIISVSMLGLAAASLAFAISPDRTLAFIAVFFIGGFGGSIESLVSSLVADLNPHRSSYYINLSQIFLCAGAVVGPLLSSITVSSGLGWRASFDFLAILTFLLFLIFNQSKIAASNVENTPEINLLKETIWDKKFLIVCLCIGFYAGSEVGAWGWMTTFLKDDKGFSIETSAIIMSAFWIAMTVGRMICGKLTKYFEIEYITIVLAFLSVLAIVMSGFVTQAAAILIVSISMGLAFSSQFPFLLSIGSKRRSNALAFSFMVGSAGLGVIIIPFLIGWIGDDINIHTAILSPSLFFLVIGLILYFGGYIPKLNTKRRSEEYAKSIL